MKPPKCNLSNEDGWALRNLQSDEIKIVLKADKGNTTVVTEQRQHRRKLLQLLNDHAYCNMKNPTNQIGKRFKGH